MQSILLLAATAITTEHLLELVRAFLPVYVLLERVQIKQGQHLAACVVGPEGGNDLVLDRTRIAKDRKL